MEEFSFDKVLSSIAKTGLAFNESEDVAKRINSWIVSSKLKMIDSVQIRDKIIELLKEVDPAAADSYKAYKEE